MTDAEFPQAQPPGEPQPQPTEAPLRKTADERKSLLAQYVANNSAAGWRVESQSDYQVVMTKGKKTNHVLHLILTLVTCGFWGIVWIILAVVNKTSKQILAVDDFGNVRVERI